jgi:hypothetical protein
MSSPRVTIWSPEKVDLIDGGSGVDGNGVPVASCDGAVVYKERRDKGVVYVLGRVPERRGRVDGGASCDGELPPWMVRSIHYELDQTKNIIRCVTSMGVEGYQERAADTSGIDEIILG